MLTLDWILSIVTSYGYVALFLATVVEGPIVTVIGALLASQGILNVVIVYAVVVLGDLFGDVLFYGLGRSGWTTLLVSRGKSSERRQRQFAVLKRRFHTRAGGTLLLGKLTHAAGFLVLFAAGAARVPITKFIWYNLLGSLPKSAIFIMIGYFSGTAYSQINTYLGIFSLIAFPFVVLGLGIYLRRRLAVDELGA